METQTRSLSSSIVDFFRKPNEQSVVRYDNDEKELDDSQSGLVHDLRENMILPDGQGSLILFETSSQLRPPVLPILPIQRLRLLRQKQELRQRLNSSVLRSALGPLGASELSLLEASYRCPSSSTPSPVKPTGFRESADALKTLKSRKVVQNERRGTRWCGQFDYDLSEYDNHDKESKVAIKITQKDHMDSPTITTTKSAAVSDDFRQSVNVSSLSAAQRDILLKGQPISASTQPAENSVVKDSPIGAKNVMQEDKAVLPSIGFDFIKPDDTPSKKSNVQPAKKAQQHEQLGSFQFKTAQKPLNGASDISTTKPTFNFTTQANTVNRRAEEDETEEPRRKKAARLSDEKATVSSLASTISSGENESGKPRFSFGKGPMSSLHNKEEKVSTPKPSFSFGKLTEGHLSVNNNIKEDKERGTGSNINSLPTFSFGQKQTDQIQEKPPSLFGNGKAGSTSSKPAFSFGNGTGPASEAKANQENKKSEALSGDAAGTGQDKSTASEPKQSFSFKLPNDEKKNAGSKPTFSFAQGAAADKKDVSVKPTFSFGQTPNKSVAPASFSFGANASSDKKETPAIPSFTFGQTEGPEKKERPAAPSFSLGAPTAHENKGTSQAASSLSLGINKAPEKNAGANATSFSFGSGAASDKKDASTASFTFNMKQAPLALNKGKDAAPDGGKTMTNGTFKFGAGSTSASQPASSKGFTFDRIGKSSQSDTDRPPFAFGRTSTTESGPSMFGTATTTSNTNLATENSGFNFNKTGSFAPGNNALPNPSGQDNKATTPSFGFKFGAGNNNNGTSNTAAPAAQVANPFLGGNQNSNGFSFKMTGNINANADGSASFGQTQPAQPAFGTTPSPAFGKSASPPVINGSNNSSRAFTPSNTINMNFSNNTAVNPGSIFAGNSGVSNMGSAAPQQIFGGTPPPAQIFGAGSQATTQFGNASVGFGTSDGLAAGQLAQSARQAPMPNFQLPPGRKLARMRQSRR